VINQAVHEKYRSSKLGRVPSDWQDVKFADMFDERREFTNDTEKYPLYSLTIEEGVTPKTERYERSYLIKKIEDNFKIVRKDDFVYNPMNLRFGSIARHKEENEVCVSGYYNVFKIKNGYSPVFIEHYLKSERMMYLYNSIATGSLKEKQRVHFSQFLELELPMPSVKESEKIADILSTWDKAIELKKNLIEQKKEQKKGLMQRLLTGEVRLPGFKGEWKEVRLGEVLKERKETGHVHLELLAITAQRGIVRRDEVDIKDNSSEDKSKYKRIMPLDIGYNTMRMWQGVSGVSKYEGIVSPAYTVLKPTDKVDSYFMGYLFKLPKVIDKFRRYSQGLVDDTLNLKYENFKVIKVRIPQDVNEQKAIAQILICVDKEIEFLEKELEALKQQKKGLMQLLLTGKIRVKC
jgi:type I restriction enzyme S subunit